MCYSILVEQDTQKLANRFSADVDRFGFNEFRNNSKVDPKKYKPLLENTRIYPNYYAPIIVAEDNRRVISPMRYRVKPSWSPEEVPAKYNLFNCRLDSIEKRKTWQPLFMQRHGILLFRRFYEWVEDKETKKKKVISFFPKQYEYVCCPVLWDVWGSKQGETVIKSFAVITTDPAPEVAAQGHDRTPIFLREENIEKWLNPGLYSKDQMYAILNDQEVVYYEFDYAA